DLVVEGAHRNDQIELGRGPRERALELAGREARGRVDDEHHGEVAAQDRHRRVLEVAPALDEHLGGGGHDAGPVGPERGHGDVGPTDVWCTSSRSKPWRSSHARVTGARWAGRAVMPTSRQPASSSWLTPWDAPS